MGGRGGGVALWFLATPIQFPGRYPWRLRWGGLYRKALPDLWCESSRNCATYGNCSQQTSGIQLHLHRCSLTYAAPI